MPFALCRVLYYLRSKSHDANGKLRAARKTFESSSLASSSPGPAWIRGLPARFSLFACAGRRPGLPSQGKVFRALEAPGPILANRLRAIKQAISASLADVVKRVPGQSKGRRQTSWRKLPQQEWRQTQVSLHSFLSRKKARFPLPRSAEIQRIYRKPPQTFAIGSPQAPRSPPRQPK